MLLLLLIQFLALTIVLRAWFFWTKRPEKYPPGPLALPIIGNLHQIGLQPYTSLNKLGKKYGNVFAVDIVSLRCVVLNSNTAIREAMSMDEFSGRPILKSFKDRSGGLALASGRTWMEQRRFALKTLRDVGIGRKSMEGIIKEEIKQLTQLFNSKTGQSIPMANIFNGPILNSLWHITTGEKHDYNDPLLAKVIRAVTGIVSESSSMGVWLYHFFPAFAKLFPNASGYNQFKKVFESANKTIQTVLEKHKAYPPVDGAPRDFVDLYIREILNEKDSQSSFFGKVGEFNLNLTLQDMFMAAVDTTSKVLEWAFFLLAHHPKEQEKLFAEIQSVVGSSRIPGLTDRNKMIYTQAVIMEVLRFSPVLPIVPRNTIQDVQFQGFFIPKDTVVLMNIYGASYDANVWEDPDSFCPARFILPGGVLNWKQESLITFSAGKRFCIGEKLARDQLFLLSRQFFKSLKYPLTGDTQSQG